MGADGAARIYRSRTECGLNDVVRVESSFYMIKARFDFPTLANSLFSAALWRCVEAIST